MILRQTYARPRGARRASAGVAWQAPGLTSSALGRRLARLVGLCLTLALCRVTGQDPSSIRTGLEGLAWQSPETIHETERPLVEALREPLLAGMDCAAALQYWFDGHTADARGDKAAAAAAWAAGRNALAGIHPLPAPTWPTLGDTRLTPLRKVEGQDLYMVTAFVITWKTDAGAQYGLLMVPQSIPTGHRFPLLVYVRRSRDGLDATEITWLGEQCRKGYAVVAPALRGQPLASQAIESLRQYRSEGSADDIAGGSTEVLTAMQGAAKLPVARPESCALLALGSGALSALLAAGRSTLPACVAVVEAGGLNPFRDYWSRLARRENHWPDWEVFCSREPAVQLASMAQRSVAHRAASIRCPVLLLLPEESVKTLDEEAHRDVVACLAKAGQEALLEIPPGTHCGFTADLNSAPAQAALQRLLRFARRYVPPDDGKDPPPTSPPQPPGSPHGN